MNHSGPDFNRQATLWNFEPVFGWVTTAAEVGDALQMAISKVSSAPQVGHGPPSSWRRTL